MRKSQIMTLVRLYNTFFVRRILNFGVLSNPIIKILLFIGFIIIFLFTSFSVFAFFSETLHSEEIVLFLLNTYSSTIVLWTIVVTIFLKFVFSKVDKFLILTVNFPINNKERNFSLFIFETFISLLIITILSFSVVTSIIWIHKLAFVDVLVVNILYISTLSYLILQVISKLIASACYYLKLTKIFHIINISVLIIIFSIFLKEARQLVTNLSSDLLNKTESTRGILVWLQKFHAEYGFLKTTSLYLFITTLLISVIIILPDRSYMFHNKHLLTINKVKSINLLKTYMLSFVRNINTVHTISFVYLASFILMIFQLDEYILYPIVFLSFNSIYSYIQSQNIRVIMYNLSYQAWRDYLYLIGSQMIAHFIVTLPLLFLGILSIQNHINLIAPYGFLILGTLILTMTGILFPPYNDNPFSVVTSMVVVIIPILVIGISLSFLNLGLIKNVAIMIFFYFVVVQFSIQGLHNLKRSERYEDLG